MSYLPLYATPKAMNCERDLRMREKKDILIRVTKNALNPEKLVRRNTEDILAVPGHDYALHLLLHTVRSIVCDGRFLSGIL